MRSPGLQSPGCEAVGRGSIQIGNSRWGAVGTSQEKPSHTSRSQQEAEAYLGVR